MESNSHKETTKVSDFKYNLESQKVFLDICKLEYESGRNRATKLEGRSSILATILSAVIALIPAYFNIKDIINYRLVSGLDLLKLSLILLPLLIGIVLILWAIYKLYTIIHPHDYRIANLSELYLKYKDKQNENVTYCLIIAELIECLTYNNKLLNKEYRKYNEVYIIIAVSAIFIIVSCFGSKFLL